jgi:ADP-ribose pyrophosphatase YjhB (NUDIX family)
MSGDSSLDPKRSPGPSVRVVPAGDNRLRLTCPDCGYIEYSNPKVIVGAVCTWEDKILLCRRAIEPRLGYWTTPAGFLEMNESTTEGAAREVLEESGAEVEIEQLLGWFEVPHISQIHMVYAARMLTPKFEAGVESLEVKLVTWEEIPWDDLAFPSIAWGLRRFKEGGPPIIHTARPKNPPRY